MSLHTNLQKRFNFECASLNYLGPGKEQVQSKKSYLQLSKQYQLNSKCSLFMQSHVFLICYETLITDCIKCCQNHPPAQQSCSVSGKHLSVYHSNRPTGLFIKTFQMHSSQIMVQDYILSCKVDISGKDLQHLMLQNFPANQHLCRFGNMNPIQKG